MNVTVLAGNPRAESRTLNVARAVAAAVCERFNAKVSLEVDLAAYANSIFSPPNQTIDELNEAVAQCDILVVASPTYKATYTGLLKGFLDRYETNGLAGVTAIPVMTGESSLHAMSIELGLRPLLVELGASVPTRGLYFLVSQMAELDSVVAAWANHHLHPGGLLGPRLRAGVQS